MKKKIGLVLLIALLLAGNLYAQKANKHEAGNILLGVGIGGGATPNFFTASGDTIKKGNYASVAELGVNLDYYLSSWLSFNTGVFVHLGAYLFLDEELILGGLNIMDCFQTPICITVPIMAHINIPKVQWLYLGAGATFNFPISNLTESELIGIDNKGTFFLGAPVDLGFDFIKPGRGGMRFFFRVTPEVHREGTPIIISFMWQTRNFKLK